MKIFFHTQPSPAIARWRQLSECVGITGELTDIAPLGLLATVLRELEAKTNEAILLDVASFKDRLDAKEIAELAAGLIRCDAKVLLLVNDGSETANHFVKSLTGGAVARVVSAGRPGRVTFPASSRGFSQSLAGQTYPREAGEAVGLEIDRSVEVLMQLGECPAFVTVPLGRAQIFVWATDDVFDVLRPLREEKEFEWALDQYIPGIIFLRHTQGDRCWRSPWIGAGIVIDDPLLEKNYGFINFPQLLASARRNAYRVTLAFIPWNHWRGSAAKARMFQDHADCFSICVHGCDHTNREYASSDYADLLTRNFTATRRMEQHRARTGMAFEPLMVCPQELYSLEAMRAFADSRQFAGLVCTACMPRDLAAPQLRGADLLLPAPDSFFGVPVFKRHYWSSIAVFAMAVFLGKPAILVEHHEFFREGPGGAEKFASELAKICPQARWAPLTETARRTHLRRWLAEHRHEIHFFTDDFEMTADQDGAAQYDFLRQVPATTNIRRVTVNGVETSCEHRNGRLTFTVSAAPAQTLRIRVDVDAVQPKKNGSRSLKYHAALVLRRGLSEFRDNVLAKNDGMLRAARKLAKKLRQTGN